MPGRDKVPQEEIRPGRVEGSIPVYGPLSCPLNIKCKEIETDVFTCVNIPVFVIFKVPAVYVLLERSRFVPEMVIVPPRP